MKERHDPGDGDRFGPEGGGPGAEGADPLDRDEDELRRMLHESVQDIEPTAGTLEYLHEAVPVRRTRRRQVAVGTAAAIFLGGAAIPALLHADLMPGDGDGRPLQAASHAQTQGPGEQSSAGDTNAGTSGQGGTDGSTQGESSGPGDEDGPAGTSGPDPTHTLGAVSPRCASNQLVNGEPTHSTPDGEGRIYGSFRVVNVSDGACTVDGDGVVAASAQGGARSNMIQVVDHTTNDPATGLPDPSLAADEVVLRSGEAYVVKFAWIPREGGGTTGCSASPSPGADGGSGGDDPMSVGGAAEGGEGSPGTSAGGGAASGGGGDTGGTSGSSSGGSGGSGSSVVVSHTPDSGDPPADTTLSGACAGTIYRTGILPAE